MTSSAPAPRRHALSATYRVQLNKQFTLNDARAIVPYLDRLGVSHLYCSPILAARPGSTHGYDVIDPTRVNPEIGTIDDLRALAGALHERGMGILLDIVPNHMGIGVDNRYWEDVLTHGVRSRYARWFDVDWGAADNKLVLPVLGDELDKVLERNELKLDVKEKTPRLRYFDNSWPVDPATLSEELQLAKFDPTAVTDPSVFLEGPEGQRRLRSLLDAQHYRLAFWRRSGRKTPKSSRLHTSSCSLSLMRGSSMDSGSITSTDCSTRQAISRASAPRSSVACRRVTAAARFPSSSKRFSHPAKS